MPRPVWALALLAMLGALSTTAHAYVRTTTCNVSSDASDPLACQPGEDPKPLYWNSSCVVYHINQAGLPEGENPDDVYNAIRRSGDEWTGQTCSYMSLIDGGFTDEDRIGYNSCKPTQNANIIVFRTENWTHQRGALALTSVTYDMRSGEIVDADMELNNTGTVTFTTTDITTQVGIDVENTVTHEMGHMIGLAHSPDPESTMFATAPRGETKKRDLAQDDIDGLCAIYPAGSSAPACDTSGVGFFAKPTQAPGAACSSGGTGCACAVTGGATAGDPVGLVAPTVAVGLLVAGRRRNRRGRTSG